MAKTWSHTRPDWAKGIDPEEFDFFARPAIGRVLASPYVRRLCLCDPDHPSWIVAFAVCGPDLLYFVYVRTELRGNGLAKKLLAELGVGPDARVAWPTRDSRRMGFRRVSFFSLFRYIVG
jgi:hypothetical protein